MLFPAWSKKNKKNQPRKKILLFWEMELSTSNIKKIILTFSQKKLLYFLKRKLLLYFLIFLEMEPCTSQPKPKKKIKKNPPRKNSLYFWKWNCLALMLKRYLYFLKRKLFLYFPKRKLCLYFLKRKLFLIFRKWNSVLFSSRTKNEKNPPRQNF